MDVHICSSFNSVIPLNRPKQYEGTALFSIGSSACRVCDKGSDISQLGRWSWTRLSGKNGHSLCIISAYRPNMPNGPFTVYAQQNAVFNSRGTPRCPRIAFLEDLAILIQSINDAKSCHDLIGHTKCQFACREWEFLSQLLIVCFPHCTRQPIKLGYRGSIDDPCAWNWTRQWSWAGYLGSGQHPNSKLAQAIWIWM